MERKEQLIYYKYGLNNLKINKMTPKEDLKQSITEYEQQGLEKYSHEFCDNCNNDACCCVLKKETLKKSTSHNDIFTGILDKNGFPILKTSLIQITDSKKDILGKVVWKNGSYVFRPIDLKKNKYYCEYNIYAWRKSIVVVNSESNSFFHEANMQESLEFWERKELTFTTSIEERKIFRRAFQLGYESVIENKLIEIVKSK
jgi:hypothetical protein